MCTNCQDTLHESKISKLFLLLYQDCLSFTVLHLYIQDIKRNISLENVGLLSGRHLKIQLIPVLRMKKHFVRNFIWYQLFFITVLNNLAVIISLSIHFSRGSLLEESIPAQTFHKPPS